MLRLMLVFILLPVTVQTAAAEDCGPDYADQRVPIAPDVDCAGGRGNGPACVSGPVFVARVDICKLDRDGDGVACD